MCIDSQVLQVIGITVLIAASAGCTTTTGDEPTALSIKEIGSMHVGGRQRDGERGSGARAATRDGPRWRDLRP